MKTLILLTFAFFLFSVGPANPETAGKDASGFTSFWNRMRSTIERHLHRPYVWGSSGLKSFDCSGFVWRVLNDSGLPVKRTTARKYYMSLPAIEENQEYRSGNIVFFDNMKHCGIVSSDQKFYHARTSLGTTLDNFDSYWNKKVYGFRAIPVPDMPRQ